MKPENFPTRKHQRRVEALERKKKYVGEFPSRNDLREIGHLQVLNEKPVTAHTKKDRTSHAALRRI